MHGPEQVALAVAAARQAQRAWQELSVEQRADKLQAFCRLLVDHAEELVNLIVLETSKARLEALTNEVFVLADVITWQCKHAPRILKSEERPLHLLRHRRSVVSYVPRGVVAIISPWNYPLMLPFADVCAATLAGNAAVLKPSEHASLIALKAKELWDQSGLPAELLQVVTGGPTTGSALLDAGVQKVAFTGGTEIGRKVAEHAGRNLIECVLELGGKAPMIVCDDADLERTAQAIVWGGFANLGQACVSVERVLAHHGIYPKLVERTTELVRSLRQGAPEDVDVDVGALVLKQRLAHLEGLVADALDKGATLAAGGTRLERRGNFYAPTLLTDCTREMRVMQEEIFGPIVPIMQVQGDSEAIAIANSLPYGLTSYVFSKDTARAEAIASEIEAGSVVVNDVHSDIASPEVPFGGIKNSGYGRIHGSEGLRAMCHVKHVSVNRTPLPARSPFWFPYDQRDFSRALKGLRLLFGGRGPLSRLAKWL